MDVGLLESVPIIGVYVGIAAMMMASCEVGFRIGVRTRSRQDENAFTSIGPMVGGLLGMLGFVLAFTFSMAAAQFDLRKHNVLEEANVIGTAYLRADLIPEPHASEVRALLREYVDVRLAGAARIDFEAQLMRSVDIHEELWKKVSALAISSPNTNSSLVLQVTNDLIDMHEKRLSGALHNRIPTSIWIALLAITSLTMLTMGLQVGLTGKRRFIAIAPLTLAFAVLVTLVVDLDQPGGGLITVGQQAMIDLQAGMANGAK